MFLNPISDLSPPPHFLAGNRETLCPLKKSLVFHKMSGRFFFFVQKELPCLIIFNYDFSSFFSSFFLNKDGFYLREYKPKNRIQKTRVQKARSHPVVMVW